MISTHAPLAGRDHIAAAKAKAVAISTHAPLAGRDRDRPTIFQLSKYFNPRAPCGARLTLPLISMARSAFQPTRPLRGATTDAGWAGGGVMISTHAPLAGRDKVIGEFTCDRIYISTHAPLAGRDGRRVRRKHFTYTFQPTRPLRGATGSCASGRRATSRFQPTRPLRGATAKVYKSLCTFLR